MDREKQMPTDVYRTIAGMSQGLYRDRGSKFIGYAMPVTTEDQIRTYLIDLRKEHGKARHVCYAYRLGTAGTHFRMTDDGEPSGTAGRPIFNQIRHFEITNVVVVVVRYFGGTKLGTSGLINAYKTCAGSALTQAEIVDRFVTVRYRLVFDYAIMGDLMNQLKALDLHIVQKTLNAQPWIEIDVRKSTERHMIRQIKAKLSNRPIEMIDVDMPIDHCSFHRMDDA